MSTTARPGPGLTPGARSRPIGMLWLDVQAARQALAEERRRPAHDTSEVLLLRRGLLTALEAYVGRLEGAHLPVPYLLRDELRLHQRLFS